MFECAKDISDFISAGCQIFNTFVRGGGDVLTFVTDSFLTLLPSVEGKNRVACTSEKKGRLPVLTGRQVHILNGLANRSAIKRNLWIRVRIILALAQGCGKSEIAKRLGICRKVVYKWLKVWFSEESRLRKAEKEEPDDRPLCKLVISVLSDAPRSGKPIKFSAEQMTLITAAACEKPENSGIPLNYWDNKTLAKEMILRGVVTDISPRTVGRILNDACVKPHLTRYWMNADPDDPELFQKQAKAICQLYLMAALLYAQGVHLISVDEKTGIQALEHMKPARPVRPNSLEKQEFHYKRNGTLCLIANFEVATGKITFATTGPTRTEKDFLDHIAKTTAADPDGEWIFIMDQLNTHKSASLVQFVAQRCNIDTDLGKKERRGILKSQKTREAFLSDPSHRIRIIYTPKHASWLNQIEIWFSILVRRLLKRSSFKTTEELQEKILHFIKYFNDVMAKPFKWTYTGRPLTV